MAGVGRGVVVATWRTGPEEGSPTSSLQPDANKPRVTLCDFADTAQWVGVIEIVIGINADYDRGKCFPPRPATGNS